jgi:uncharacterized protein (DUF849 family)
MLHVHVRDPETGQGSANFDQYNYLIGRLRQAVPKMILQVGGSISFAPHTARGLAEGNATNADGRPRRKTASRLQQDERLLAPPP